MIRYEDKLCRVISRPRGWRSPPSSGTTKARCPCCAKAKPVEAAVAAAATIAVVYPHMNGLGGDGFWPIVVPPQGDPIAIDASGRRWFTGDAEPMPG